MREKRIEEITDVISEEYNNGNDNWFSVAERVYDKLFPKNAVVLTMEEYERHKGFSREEVDEISKTAIKNSRKEKAREIICEIKAFIYDNDNLMERLDIIAKQYGVEVEE